MIFAYKTRSNTLPDNKPKIYFSCHQEDFAPFFEGVAKDILEIVDCAIYYCDGERVADEEYFLHLQLMQLIVFPVTSKLLRGNNRALDADLQFAKAQNIPILPLMMEKGLEEEFNEKFGNLHFLSCFNQNPAANSYGKHLETFLQAFFIDKSLEENVRNAFDAYVFLSYRKKDGKYVKKLRELIHQIDRCRDVAIWYDEYLIPGENFEEKIESLIHKSDIFALLVTPQLLEDPNYVKDKEFPFVKNLGKNVIAVEFEKTLKEELRESFDGIPSILSASVDEVKQGITEALKGVRLREKRDSLHDYFIGLAYLYGIDVEVNHEKAVEIIEGAARRGCLSAIKKASDIYYYAIGNGKDLAKAIAWQKRYTLALKAAYSLDRQEEELLQYLQEELCLAKMQREAGELSVARNTCWRVLMYCKRDGRYGAFFSPTRIPYYVQAYDILGDIFHTREDKLQSIECYEKALKEAERQAELAGDDLGALALFGRICFKLGNAYLSIKDSERFMKLTDRLTNMVELPRLSFIGSIERIGVLFQKGIRAFEKIKEIEFSEDNLRNLASSYVALCDFYMQYKSFGIKSEENALFDTCEQALQIFEDLKTRSFTVMHCKGYCEALLLKGSLFQMYKKNAEALAEYDKALLFVSMLPREMQTVEIEDFVCRCNLEKAKLLSGLKMRLGCLATCRNCIQYAKQLYETYGKDIYAVYMAEAYFVGSFFFSPYGKEAYKLLSALCYKTDEYGDLFFQVCLSLWERKLLKLQDVPRTTIYADEERNGGIWFSNSLNSRHTFIRFRFIGTQPHKKILAVELSEFTLLSLQGSSYKDIDLCEMGFFTSKKETRPDDYFVVIFADGTQCEYQRCYG